MASYDVSVATQADWQTLKNVRLSALADAPEAFGSNLARENAFEDAEWQRRVGPGSDCYLARLDGRAVGMVATVLEEEFPGERHLVGMWVAPEHRGSTVATELVEAVLATAGAAGLVAVSLWVADPNARASRFYERLGFLPTGERQPLPSNPNIGERRMRRTI